MISMYFTVVLLGCRCGAVPGTPSLPGTERVRAPRHHRSLDTRELYGGGVPQDRGATRLTAARASMIMGAIREIQVRGMSFSRPRPPTMASPPTAHSARTAPVATDAGSW